MPLSRLTDVVSEIMKVRMIDLAGLSKVAVDMAPTHCNNMSYNRFLQEAGRRLTAV